MDMIQFRKVDIRQLTNQCMDEILTLKRYSRGKQFAKEVERAKYWKVRDTILIVWMVGLLFAATWTFGYLKGLTSADSLNAWADTATAQ